MKSVNIEINIEIDLKGQSIVWIYGDVEIMILLLLLIQTVCYSIVLYLVKV